METIEAGGIVGTAIINQIQVDVYANVPWQYPADDAKVMVLHTLVIFPSASGSGYGSASGAFYDEYALKHGCHFLRINTNARNKWARIFYKRLAMQQENAEIQEKKRRGRIKSWTKYKAPDFVRPPATLLKFQPI